MERLDVFDAAHVKNTQNVPALVVKCKHVLITGIINFYISAYGSHKVKL